MKLSELEELNLRDVWEKEDTHFTKWLSEDKNLKILGSELGIEIELEDIKSEHPVGKFKADLFCTDDQGNNIIIENQLEKTNHDHLGKLITYASGLDCKTIIWIVKDANPEHMQAIEWLNNKTDDLNFFLVKIRVFKIDNSSPAPKFEILIQPNDWSKKLQRIVADKEGVSPGQQEARRYWNHFTEYMSEFYTNSKTPSIPLKSIGYLYFSIGTSKGHIRLRKSLRESVIRITLVIKKKHFDVAKQILNNKEDIKELIHCDKVHWNEEMLEKNQEIWFSFEKRLDDMTEEEQFEWLCQYSLKLKEWFSSKYVQ